MVCRQEARQCEAAVSSGQAAALREGGDGVVCRNRHRCMASGKEQRQCQIGLAARLSPVGRQELLPAASWKLPAPTTTTNHQQQRSHAALTAAGADGLGQGTLGAPLACSREEGDRGSGLSMALLPLQAGSRGSTHMRLPQTAAAKAAAVVVAPAACYWWQQQRRGCAARHPSASTTRAQLDCAPLSGS